MEIIKQHLETAYRSFPSEIAIEITEYVELYHDYCCMKCKTRDKLLWSDKKDYFLDNLRCGCCLSKSKWSASEWLISKGMYRGSTMEGKYPVAPFWYEPMLWSTISDAMRRENTMDDVYWNDIHVQEAMKDYEKLEPGIHTIKISCTCDS